MTNLVAKSAFETATDLDKSDKIEVESLMRQAKMVKLHNPALQEESCNQQ